MQLANRTHGRVGCLPSRWCVTVDVTASRDLSTGNARFSPDTKSIEVSVLPRQASAAICSRIKGQAPLAATVYELEKLRCNLCGNVYTAEAPADAGEKKYDESAAAMIALLRYGSGVPWNRTEGLEANWNPAPRETSL